MGGCGQAAGSPSTRTLINLAATYAGAAGRHGVLAARFSALWHVVLAPVTVGAWSL